MSDAFDYDGFLIRKRTAAESMARQATTTEERIAHEEEAARFRKVHDRVRDAAVLQEDLATVTERLEAALDELRCPDCKWRPDRRPEQRVRVRLTALRTQRRQATLAESWLEYRAAALLLASELYWLRLTPKANSGDNAGRSDFEGTQQTEANPLAKSLVDDVDKEFRATYGYSPRGGGA